MEYETLDVADVARLTPRVFGDERGFFLETFRQNEFERRCGAYSFVQDNHSRSVRGTLRGLHYQLEHPQGKLVRELPAHDAALCETLGASAETVGQRVLALADLVIANSRCVAGFFETLASPLATKPPIQVVPNTTAMESLQSLSSPAAGNAMTVGLLSSNQPKKGLADIEATAKTLAQLAPEVRVAIYGPRTPALDALLARQAQGLAPANLDYRGYVAAPGQALAELDVLVNLSRFQESFGRTVLEAMAAGRPVVCYAWGALPELIVDGESGYLVAFAEPEAVAQRVAELARDPQRRAVMGQAGRERARERFSLAQMAQRLKHVYADVIRMD